MDPFLETLQFSLLDIIAIPWYPDTRPLNLLIDGETRICKDSPKVEFISLQTKVIFSTSI